MEFIETKIFTKQITKLLPDEEYKRLQSTLILSPEAGDLIRNGGGLRKIRWKLAGTGKSGGIRAIYYYLSKKQHIFFVIAYAKSRQDNISDKELATLRKIIED